jgi:hypothetical protein
MMKHNRALSSTGWTHTVLYDLRTDILPMILQTPGMDD